MIDNDLKYELIFFLFLFLCGLVLTAGIMSLALNAELKNKIHVDRLSDDLVKCLYCTNLGKNKHKKEVGNE
jgi:hypothetical protein